MHDHHPGDPQPVNLGTPRKSETVCAHENFASQVNVIRLQDSGQFLAEITIGCTDCGKRFQFMNLPPGLDLQGSMCSVDGLEARLAICPVGAKPSPLQRMAFGVTKFDG